MTVDIPVVRAAEIVLRARAADGRKLAIAVDEELDFALAPPTRIGDADRQVAADVVALAINTI